MGSVVTVDVDDLSSGQLLQINGKGGSDLYRFLEQYPNGTVTVEWLFTQPRGAESGYLPARTAVTRLNPEQLFDFVEPSDALIGLYEEVATGRRTPASAEQR